MAHLFLCWLSYDGSDDQYKSSGLELVNIVSRTSSLFTLLSYTEVSVRLAKYPYSQNALAQLHGTAIKRPSGNDSSLADVLLLRRAASLCEAAQREVYKA